MLHKSVLPLLFLISFCTARSQNYGRTYREIGIMTGPLYFQGDFGNRFSTENIIKNVGVSGTIVYYFTPNVDLRHFEKNYKIRLDITMMTVNLRHYGESASSNSFTGAQLRAMRSDLKIGSAGVQFEYYPWQTNDYNRGYFSPYIAAGGQINSYSSKAYSYLGKIGTPLVVPDKYVESFKSTSGIIFSTTASAGFRYRIDDYRSVILEGQIKYYFSDWVEGMNPDRKIYEENKDNDFSTGINIGFVYYFN